MIDDEESIRYVVDAGLEFICDYDVNFADDGISGIESLKKFEPDLVLVDLVLLTLTEWKFWKQSGRTRKYPNRNVSC